MTQQSNKHDDDDDDDDDKSDVKYLLFGDVIKDYDGGNDVVGTSDTF